MFLRGGRDFHFMGVTISPGSLRSENLERLTEKVCILALRAARNNRCGEVLV
jgi:hypothetical protein